VFFNTNLNLPSKEKGGVSLHGEDYFVWPRWGCGAPHSHDGALPCFCGSRSRPCSARYGSYNPIGAQVTDPGHLF
jgi:hypothetical protein